MKKPLWLLLLFFASCGWSKIDPVKARAVAENFLNDQKNERYDELNNYFTPSFNESEPLEQKVEKLKKIKDAFGALESFELTDTKESQRGLDDPSTVQFTYKVKYARGAATQNLIVMNEEGEPKITFMNVVTVAPPVLENN